MVNPNIQYDENKMFHPDDVVKLMYSNALEEYCYFDTVLISNKIDQPAFTKYDGAGYFGSYQALGNQSRIPFFKTRNEADVGEALNNMEQKDRMSVPFHLFGLAVKFFTPAVSANEGLTFPTDQRADTLFNTLIPQHSSFSFKVGQVEKMRANVGIMPAAGGLVNDMFQMGSQQSNGSVMAQGYASGWQRKWNTYTFKTPIGIARNQSIEGTLEFSEYAQQVLQGMEGPVQYNATGAVDPSAVCGIQVKLLGVREVQFRNLQHY